MEKRPLVLVVEDNEMIRVELATILDMEGFDVVEASNGRHGLATATAKHPDLILSDLMMPEMDGYELLIAVRRDRERGTIPFVILSARGEDAAIERAMALGATSYLRKPVDIPDLIDILRTSLTAA